MAFLSKRTAFVINYVAGKQQSYVRYHLKGKEKGHHRSLRLSPCIFLNAWEVDRHRQRGERGGKGRDWNIVRMGDVASDRRLVFTSSGSQSLSGIGVGRRTKITYEILPATQTPPAAPMDMPAPRARALVSSTIQLGCPSGLAKKGCELAEIVW